MKCKNAVQFPVNVIQLYAGAGISTHIIRDLVMLVRHLGLPVTDCTS